MISRRALSLLLFLICCGAGPAGAVTLPGFDHARPVAPQHVETGGAFAFGTDDVLSAYGLARIGVLDDLAARVRAGFVHFGDQNGFEVDAGALFRFLRQQDIYVDLGVDGGVSILKTPDVFVLGVDPALLVSHHFDIAQDRQLYVSAGLGTAITIYDVDGGDSDIEVGLLGTFSAGVDVIPKVRLSLEGGLRDDLGRFGVAVTYHF